MNITAILRVDDSELDREKPYGVLLMGLHREEEDGLLYWLYIEACWSNNVTIFEHNIFGDQPIIPRIIYREKGIPLFMVPYEEGDI